MKKQKLILTFLAALSCCLVLAGCEGKTAAELEAAKSELTKAQKERDTLTAEIAKISETLEKTKLELAAAKEASTPEEQLSKLTKERDEAIADAKKAQETISTLNTQLQEQTQKLTDLQDQNNKLQTKVEELQKKPQETAAPATTNP